MPRRSICSSMRLRSCLSVSTCPWTVTCSVLWMTVPPRPPPPAAARPLLLTAPAAVPARPVPTRAALSIPVATSRTAACAVPALSVTPLAMPCGMNVPILSANSLEGLLMPRKLLAAFRAPLARFFSELNRAPAPFFTPLTMPITMFEPIDTNLPPQDLAVFHAELSLLEMVLATALIVELMVCQAEVTGPVIADLMLAHREAAVDRMDPHAELSQPEMVCQIDCKKCHTPTMGARITALMTAQVTDATALITFQVPRRKPRMAFQAAMATAVIWAWKWFQMAMTMATAGRKITSRSGHHFLKNPAIAFHTVVVTLAMWPQIVVIWCHSQVIPVTMPFHAACSACQTARAAVFTAANAVCTMALKRSEWW